MIDRREVLKLLGGLTLSTALGNYEVWSAPKGTKPIELSNVSSSIEDIRSRYNVDKAITNIENGFFGVMTADIEEKYLQSIQIVNKKLSTFARLEFPKIYADTYSRTQVYMGLPDNSMVITRNATEALNIAIQGCNLKHGDEVIISQVDYDSALACWNMLEKKKGIILKRVDVPLFPESSKQLVDIYVNAISSKTKVVHLTHLNHLTGLILPVKEIIKALPSNIITILDAAHSFEQIPLSIIDINPDMTIVNFHKWFGAPVGLGMLYVKPERVEEIQPLYGVDKAKESSIHKLANFGTLSFPAIMTLKEVVQSQKKEEQQLKTDYLQQLKEAWVFPLMNNDNVEVLTPIDAQWSRSIASFRIKGIESKEVQRQLLEEYKILTVTRKLGNEEIIRVTPHWHNDLNQMHGLVNAIQEIAG